MTLRLLAISILMLLFAVSAHAQVFKCHDADGQLTFSSFPCGEAIEKVAVSVGSGNAAPATEQLPAERQAPQSLVEGQPVDAIAQPDNPEPLAFEPHSLSPEQIELLQMHQRLQEQSDERMQEITNHEQQMTYGTASVSGSGSVSGFATNDRQISQSASNNRACESAELARDSLREQGRRGYSASQSRSYKAKLRQAKDRVRTACRRQ